MFGKHGKVIYICDIKYEQLVNSMPIKTKYKYYYENLETGEGYILDSMNQLIDLTGMSYRSLQRRFKNSNIYFHPDGKFKIKKSVWIKDGRKNNSNPNM